MAIGITPELEEGNCSVCEKPGKVRVFFDSEKGLDAKVCAECAAGSPMTAEELLAKFGKKIKTKGVSILPREDWLSSEKKAEGN
jgi:hypothetical protein